jgi:hypothetical protein
MSQDSFSNAGQLGQFVFAGVSTAFAALSFIRTVPPRYRRWAGTVAIVGFLWLLRWVFGANLPQPWTDYGMVALAAILVATVFSTVGRSKSAASPEVVVTEPRPEIERLRVKLHISKDAGVTYKKKLVITLRNVGRHDLMIGPKASWVPGEIGAQRLDQLVWELEPRQGWDSDGWKWQEAESPEVYVTQGVAFRTWVPLHENATEHEVERLKGKLGILRIPLRVKIGDFQIQV